MLERHARNSIGTVSEDGDWQENHKPDTRCHTPEAIHQIPDVSFQTQASESRCHTPDGNWGEVGQYTIMLWEKVKVVVL